MFKSILPQASFARFAEGRLDFDGDDEEYSHYLTRFADQQSLARRLMGGNVRHYNSRQQEKDAGAVNRGDFLFFGGTGDKSERKRITPVTVTKPTVVKQTDNSAGEDLKLFTSTAQKAIKTMYLLDLKKFPSVNANGIETNKKEDAVDKIIKGTTSTLDKFPTIQRIAKRRGGKSKKFRSAVEAQKKELEEMTSILNTVNDKKERLVKAFEEYRENENTTPEQDKEMAQIKQVLENYNRITPDVIAFNQALLATRENFLDIYNRGKKNVNAYIPEPEKKEFKKNPYSVYEILQEYKPEYPNIRPRHANIISKNRRENKDDFFGFSQDLIDYLQGKREDENIGMYSTDVIDNVYDEADDDEVDNVVDAIIPDNTKTKKKPEKQKKNLDLIDVKSTPVKNDTVKDTTGSNGVAFNAQPALEQDKRSVSHEQRVGKANDVASQKDVYDKWFKDRFKLKNYDEDDDDDYTYTEEQDVELPSTPVSDKPVPIKEEMYQRYFHKKLKRPEQRAVKREILLVTRNELNPKSIRPERTRYQERKRKTDEEEREQRIREQRVGAANDIAAIFQTNKQRSQFTKKAAEEAKARQEREWQDNKQKIVEAHTNLEDAWRKNWYKRTWWGKRIWGPAQKKVAVEAVQDAAAANVADGPVAAAVAAKTAVEAEAQADEANLVSNSSYGPVRKPISFIEQEFDDLERELDEPEPAEPALPEFVPPADPAPLPAAPAIEPLSEDEDNGNYDLPTEDEDEKPEKKSDPYDRMMDLLAGDSKNATKLMKYKKFKAQQEKDRNKRLEDNLKWFSDRMQERRGHSSLGSLSGFKKWDPFSQPLNKNFRNQKMENRLQQTVPPYDLPKNYPIYGGAMPGYPRVNSVPYPVYARRGRTGRRTNYEKYGVPSVRMYQQMLRNGLPPNVVARAAGRPRAVPQPPVEEQNIGPTPQYMPEYDDGPTYAEDKSYDYGEQVQRIAKNLMWGPPRRYTTGNQIVGSVLPNTTSGMPSAYYMGAKALDYITPEGQTDKEKLENMLANVKITQMVEDVKSEDDKKRLREMAKNFGNLNESGWKKALRWGATGASLGLKGLGVLSENFWPMHDAYYRYKTMSSLGGIGKSLLGMMPRGFGYRRRKKRSNKKCRKGKVCYGGMIIPPKSLKKMFEENKCDLKY